ncbi:hypothetical protein BGZ80_003151 [Entomortierella chlamydospora]|uniref:Uncharacterized protein n=1 Tax=Entomortierella chlamydospora TaxID=101097 RepID=A0A9P6SWN1_9FUNG|nr:hypothetical protein BGZ80_003151 [Entomortierella chlamydospora]
MFPAPPPKEDLSLNLEGLHEFFYGNEPERWTPTQFASHSMATDFKDYIRSLHRIKKNGTQCLRVYCSDIINYLETDPHGKDEEEQAKSSIERRKTFRMEKEVELVAKSKTNINLLKGISKDESESRHSSNNQAPKATPSLASRTTSSSSRKPNPISSSRTNPSPTTSIPHIMYDDVSDVEEPGQGHNEELYDNVIDVDESDNGYDVEESDDGYDDDEDKGGDENNSGDDAKELKLISATSPFDDLVAVLFRIYNHRVSTVATISPPLSGTLKELHAYASLNLSQWERIPDTRKKSTMLALSGILNTMDNGMQYFNDFAVTKAACFEEHFTSPSAEMKSIIDEFLGAMGTERSLRTLKTYCREQQLESTKTGCEGSDRARVINAVEYL